MRDPIWKNTLDGKYDVSVTQDEDDVYKGILRVTENGNELMEHPVTISYGAPFGVDAADVRMWQELVMQFVDTLEAEPLPPVM